MSTYTPSMSMPDAPVTTVAPPAEALQFRRAEPVAAACAQRCIACQAPITETYYHATYHTAGKVVCPDCAGRIQQGQQEPAFSFPRALLFGGGAAFAGCAIYAIVAIATGMEIGLIAILVGVMVGKAIRRASGGSGGRPQQILAVVLTYFAITTSYIPVILYNVMHKPKIETTQTNQTANNGNPSSAVSASGQSMSVSKAVLYLLAIGAVAPFLSLTSGVSGIISLFIIFIGLKQAWRLTGRPAIPLAGPYQAASVST